MTNIDQKMAKKQKGGTICVGQVCKPHNQESRHSSKPYVRISGTWRPRF